MAGPFKMKGSPMQRNFGIGSPLLDHEKDVDGNIIEHPDMTQIDDSTTVGNPRLEGQSQDLVTMGVIDQKQLNLMGRDYERRKKRSYQNREYIHYRDLQDDD